MKDKRILITGCAGYIGSHVIDELLKRGYTNIDGIDENLSNSPNDVTNSLRHFGDCSIQNSRILNEDYDVIIHLAAYISVEESTKDPVKYWRNNLMSTAKILDSIEGKDTHLIFASTGTAFCPANAYAYSKVACEEEIIDRAMNYPAPLNYTIFRFFNVSGLGEGKHFTGKATHLIRRAAMAALGQIDCLEVAGDDWDTRDGTAVRDYIHVEDLAASIVNAVENGPANTPYECLGTGNGYTVNEVLTSMKRVTGVDFDVKIASRRDGDVASMICPSQYKHISISHDLDSMCLSTFQGLSK